jgi:hypothetical protein
MLNTIKNSRDVTIKHIMHRICEDKLSVDNGTRLIKAYEEEYQLVVDSFIRFQHASYQLTDDKMLIQEVNSNV